MIFPYFFFKFIEQQFMWYGYNILKSLKIIENQFRMEKIYNLQYYFIYK